MAALNGYLALGTINASGVFTELSGAAGYARQAVTFETLGGSRIRNSTAVNFTKANGVQWPTFNAYAFYGAATGGSPIRAWGVSAPEVNDLIGPRPRSIGAGVIDIGTDYGALPLTQAQYDALTVKDPVTLYAIVG